MRQMTFDEASGRGRVGERAVSEALVRGQREHEFVLLENLLFRVKRGKYEQFAQCDHIVVDSLGILLIETKKWTHAYIRGRDFEPRWTVIYPGRQKSTEYNPLRQSEQHELVVQEALSDTGWALQPDDVESVVIFVDADDVSHLTLKARNRRRILRLEDISQMIRRRHAVCASKRGLIAPAVAELAIHLQLLDWSKDGEAVARFERKQRNRRAQESHTGGAQMPLIETA